MNKKAIIFDADGVLFVPTLKFGKYLESIGITTEDTKEFFQNEFSNCIKGKSCTKTELAKYISSWGYEKNIDEFIATWHDTEKEIEPKVQQLILSLKNNYKVVLATNQEELRKNYIKKDPLIINMFDHMFFSCDIGSIKPEKEFYSFITSNLGLNASDIIFFDDTPKHVKAAIDYGWSAHIYENPSKTKEILEKLL